MLQGAVKYVIAKGDKISRTDHLRKVYFSIIAFSIFLCRRDELIFFKWNLKIMTLYISPSNKWTNIWGVISVAT